MNAIFHYFSVDFVFVIGIDNANPLAGIPELINTPGEKTPGTRKHPAGLRTAPVTNALFVRRPGPDRPDYFEIFDDRLIGKKKKKTTYELRDSVV